MSEEFDGLYKLVFFSTVVLLVLLEQFRAFQRREASPDTRWTANVGLFLMSSVVMGLVLPVSMVTFAADQPPGVLARLGLPLAAQVVLAFLFLDFWHYWEHRLFHVVPFLWRAHLVHHSDTQVDVTTSERHHPLEILLSAALTFALIALLGLPPEALGLYVLVAVVVALWSHANLQTPAVLEHPLGWLVVTPGAHAVHHSAQQVQTDSNYGIVLTVWDRLFGTYSDPNKAKVSRLGLEYFRQPKDAALAQVLMQPLSFSRGVADLASASGSGSTLIPALVPAPDTRATAPGPVVISPAWRNTVLGLAIAVLLACAVLWPTVQDLAMVWSADEAYRYAWLVMPMVAYLMGWHFRDELLAASPKPDLTGVVVAAVAAVCWGAGALMNIDIARRLGFVLVLQGIALSALGWRLYWRHFPVLALMFMMIPSGDFLEPPLRVLTIRGIDLFAMVVGLPHRIDGYSIVIGNQLYFVIDACSGLSYVLLTFFLGYCFGLLLFRSWTKIAGLACLGAALGIGSNLLRVNAIVMIDWVRGSQMDLMAHGKIQWVALFIALGLLFYVLVRLKPEVVPAAKAVPVSPAAALPAATRQFAPMLAGVAVLLVAGAATWVPIHAARSPRGAQTVAAPQNIQGWVLLAPQPTSAPVWVVDKPSHSESLTLTYRRNGQDMRVEIIETLLPTAKLPDARLVPGDREQWRDVQRSKQQSCVASDCVTLFQTTWQRGRKYALRHVFHSYNMGGLNLKSKLALRAAHGWHRLNRSNLGPRLMVFTLEGAEPTVQDIAEVQRAIQLALGT